MITRLRSAAGKNPMVATSATVTVSSFWDRVRAVAVASPAVNNQPTVNGIPRTEPSTRPTTRYRGTSSTTVARNVSRQGSDAYAFRSGGTESRAVVTSIRTSSASTNQKMLPAVGRTAQCSITTLDQWRALPRTTMASATSTVGTTMATADRA